MPQSRIPLFVLLLAAIAGAIWLARPRSHEPAPVTPSISEVEDASPSSDLAIAEAEGPDPTAVDASEAIRSDVGSNPNSGPSRGTLRVTAVWPDASPASGVMLFLHGRGGGVPYSAFAHGPTDDGGSITFDDVPLAKVAIRSDRGDQKTVTVVAGEQEVAFELKGGVTVQGTVRRADEMVVANASVWMQSASSKWYGGRVVATTDAEGRYALQHVNPTFSIGAFAAGYAPSQLVDLELVDVTVHPTIVDLRLDSAGGQLTGTVVDVAGEPVAGALVAVGKGDDGIRSMGRRVVERWSSRAAETDADGRFTMDGLEHGIQALAIRAAGFGLHRGDVTIVENQATVINPCLQRSATIHGVVTDGEGAPVEKARVRAYDLAPRTPFISVGQIDFDELLGYVGTETDAEGRYRIGNATPGTVHLFAQRQHTGREGTSVAYTTAQLEVTSESETVWNPELADGRTIEGVVLYRDGSPMPNVFLTLSDERSGKDHTMTNGEDGKFRWLCLDDSTYTLRVQYWDAPQGTPPLNTTGLVPDGRPIELRAVYDKPVKGEKGRVTGRIDDLARRIRNPRAVHVVLASDERWFREGKIENAAYEFDDVTPGKFRMLLLEGDTMLTQTEWFDLPPAGAVEAPALRLWAAGGAKIRIVRPKGTESLEPKLYLRREGFSRSTVISVGRAIECESDNLTPGPYKVTGYAKGMASLHGQLTVTAGQISELELTLQAGARVRAEVWWPEGRTSVRRHLRILDAHGKVAHEVDGDLWSQAPLRPFPIVRTLPPGSYTLEFSTDNGLSGTAAFLVQNTTDEVSLRVDLK